MSLFTKQIQSCQPTWSWVCIRDDGQCKSQEAHRVRSKNVSKLTTLAQWQIEIVNSSGYLDITFS